MLDVLTRALPATRVVASRSAGLKASPLPWLVAPFLLLQDAWWPLSRHTLRRYLVTLKLMTSNHSLGAECRKGFVLALFLGENP